MEVRFRLFRTSQLLWEDLMQRAAEFASTLRPEDVINISHSCDSGDSVVAVWYWADIKAPQFDPRTVFC